MIIRQQRLLFNVFQLIKIHLLGFVLMFGNRLGQSYAVAQLTPNYPINSIISETKHQTNSYSCIKLLSSSKYILQTLSWISTTFRRKVSILTQLSLIRLNWDFSPRKKIVNFFLLSPGTKLCHIRMKSHC